MFLELIIPFYLFLTNSEGPEKNINNNEVQDCTIWMKWIKKFIELSHVASNMQQTRAYFAFRLEHFEWLKQKISQRISNSILFIINCSVKYFGRLCLDDALISRRKGNSVVLYRNDSEPIIKRNYSCLL